MADNEPAEGAEATEAAPAPKGKLKLIIAVVGGITRPVGPFIGAFIFVILRTFALDLLVKFGLDGNRFRLLIGLGFLAIVFWSSDGVIGLWERWRRRATATDKRPSGGHGHG